MKRFAKHLIPAIGGLLLFAATEPVLSSTATELAITIPARDGTEVGCESVVSGTAPALRPGDHVWLFAARKSFADLGLFWPQGEAEVDPETNT